MDTNINTGTVNSSEVMPTAEPDMVIAEIRTGSNRDCDTTPVDVVEIPQAPHGGCQRCRTYYFLRLCSICRFYQPL